MKLNAAYAAVSAWVFVPSIMLKGMKAPQPGEKSA